MSVVSKLVEVKEKVVVDYGGEIGEAWAVWREFIKRFPFREEPEAIDSLTPEDVYNPGVGGYFLDYVEHKLKALGHIYVPSDKPWRAARDNLEIFKKLLRIVVSEDVSLAEKIDAEWGMLPGWGGDRHYAKKIVFCYYPEEVIPIFKTEHLEHFLRILGLLEEAYRKAQAMFQRSYEELTVGQKYELLNGLLSGFKEELADFKDMDNALFA